MVCVVWTLVIGNSLEIGHWSLKIAGIPLTVHAMRPKIALLYVGGAIGMITNKKTGKIDPVDSLGEIYRYLPEMQKEVHLELFPIANVSSLEITPNHWVEIARTIEQHYDAFEGFVVIHGTNTMSYTAAALSFALQNLSKPIILTGALMPLNDMAGDARTNLVFAIRAALLDIAEVCIVLGPRVLRGCRAKKVNESILNTFDSTRFPPLADFSSAFELHPWRIPRRKRTLESRPAFDQNVLLLTLHPGLPMTVLDALLEAHPHGIVLRAYGPGRVPDALLPWLRTLREKKIPIVMTSQVLRSHVNIHQFRKDFYLNDLDLISGKDMTYECALVKLMWALTQAKIPDRLRAIMEKNLVGELDE